ncbi:YidC/Oxa1 family membrane protein insertase [uncultured Brachyspira sp.]|uniref:YidC/Oxa1 family membrane protein insertase n=1 Tax=uncultured Brachyspira sp. TaxID=221953 RepID=UPI00261AA863|nr:YidC/Oxa1 family membrane protein insertase [uncultured Brachyspira sp.]
MFGDIIYSLTIYPIEFLLETIFYYFKVLTQSSYTVSVILVSLIINILSLPLYNIAEKWQQKERDMQSKMKPMIDNIKAVYKGDQAYLLIRTCQRINGYKTIYAFRGVLGLLIQIPFFLAGYNFFTSLSGANTESFWLIKSLGDPDKIIHIGNYYINLLPFVMTAFSLASTFVYSKKLTFKQSIPIFLMSLFFLVFLYNSPAILLLYWTINCAFSFFKNIVLINIEKIKSIINKVSNNKIFILVSKIIYCLYTVLIFIMTILYFLRNTVINKSVQYTFLRAFIIHVKTYKDLLLIWFILSLIVLAIILNKKKILDFLKIESKLRLKIFISSLITITILSGLFILTSLIASSGQEFENPFSIIFTVFFKYVGIFFVYPIFLYFLFSEKFKNNITFIFILISLISLANTFIMVIDYGYISSNFKFELEYLLIPNAKQIILNIILILVILSLTVIIIKKNLINFLFNILIIITISLLAISIFDFTKINKEQKKLLQISSINNSNNDYNIFNFSKTGTNIFIIILDRGNPEFGNIVLERFPEIKKEFDGFIWYPNTTSLGAGTIGSIQALYGGYEYAPFELNEKYVLKDKHNESLLMMPQLFVNNRYESMTFDPAFANFSWIPDLTIFKGYTNIKAYNQNDSMIAEELKNLLNDSNTNSTTFHKKNIEENNQNRAVRFALFRMIPVFLRAQLYSKNDWLIPNSGRNLTIVGKSIQEFALLQALTNLTKINETGNYFNIVHSDSTHEPFNYNSNFIPSINIEEVPNEDLEYFGGDFSARTYYSTVASFKELANFFNFLKENKVYDNTKIIIVSDHSAYFSPSVFDKNEMGMFKIFNSMLYFKDINSKGNIVSNNTFMTIADVPYLASKHLENPINPFTSKLITNDMKTNGIMAIEIAGGKGDPNANYKMKYNFNRYFIVKDNIFEKTNWTIVNVNN